MKVMKKVAFGYENTCFVCVCVCAMFMLCVSCVDVYLFVFVFSCVCVCVSDEHNVTLFDYYYIHLIKRSTKRCQETKRKRERERARYFPIISKYGQNQGELVLI